MNMNEIDEGIISIIIDMILVFEYSSEESMGDV